MKCCSYECSMIAAMIAAVQKYANLVELEKCCQTHIFLQKFVLIQPRTSPPKIICKIANFAPSYSLKTRGPPASGLEAAPEVSLLRAFGCSRSSLPGSHAVREQLQERFCASEQFIRLCFTSCGVALLSRALAPYPPPCVSR